MKLYDYLTRRHISGSLGYYTIIKIFNEPGIDIDDVVREMIVKTVWPSENESLRKRAITTCRTAIQELIKNGDITSHRNKLYLKDSKQ